MTLKNLKRWLRIGMPLMMMVLFASAFPRTAEASYYRGHHGYHGYRYGGHHYGHYGYRSGYGHHYRHRGSYSYGHRGSYGYGHHYRPYYGNYGHRSSHYGPTGGLDRDVAQRAGLGALDLNVRPKKKVEVYV